MGRNFDDYLISNKKLGVCNDMKNTVFVWFWDVSFALKEFGPRHHGSIVRAHKAISEDEGRPAEF